MTPQHVWATVHVAFADRPEAARRRTPARTAWFRAGLVCALLASACTRSDELVRSQAVRDTVFARGIKDEAVLGVLRTIPREVFIGTPDTEAAYADGPAKAEGGVVVPSTYLLGLVLSLARPQGDHRVLEFGTGTGYQAAALSKLAAKVYSMDAPGVNFDLAHARWESLGLTNIDARPGTVNEGWNSAAPFDVIVLWNAPPYVPVLLSNQLQTGGRLVAVHGPLDAAKEIRIIEKRRDRSTSERVVVPVAP